MPEGRILLKSISQSKKLSMLKTDGARLLYSWLIPHLDINGCYYADPDVINGKILTRLKKSSKTTEGYLDDLEKNGLIIRYEADGDDFLIVPDFTDKQPKLRPDREAKPSIPPPKKEQLRMNSGANPDKLQMNSHTSKVKLNLSKVKNSNTNVLLHGAEKTSSKAPKINFSFEFEKWEDITEKDKKHWRDAYPACDIEIELNRMKAWLLANPKKRKKDYKRFINNWLSRTQDKGGTRTQETDFDGIKEWAREQDKKRGEK